MAYELIETIEVGAGGAASIEFTSIPQDGVDLAILLSGRTDGANVTSSIFMQLNSDTANNYAYIILRGTGSSASSTSDSPYNAIRVCYFPGANSTSNTFGNATIYLPNYTSSTSKSIASDSVQENNATASYQNITAGSYSNSTGITSVKLYPASGFGNWAQYSTASLYKIY